MTRKFDKYGFNRQYLRKPLSRRDPFPRDHLPFVSDFSVGSSMHNAATNKGPGPLKGAVDKGFKEAHRAYQKAKRQATKALRKEAKHLKKTVKSHLMEELEGAAVIGGTWLLSYLLAPATGVHQLLLARKLRMWSLPVLREQRMEVLVHVAMVL